MQLNVPAADSFYQEFDLPFASIIVTDCSCLDRTNVAQFSAGVEAIEQQLVVMGIRSSAKLDSTANIVRVLIDMYVDIGDSIALQYGGSEAHKKVNTENSPSTIVGPMGKVNYQYFDTSEHLLILQYLMRLIVSPRGQSRQSLAQRTPNIHSKIL